MSFCRGNWLLAMPSLTKLLWQGLQLHLTLLAAACRQKIRFAGNTAQEGAKAVLLNRRAA